jgi:hypothetical protein
MESGQVVLLCFVFYKWVKKSDIHRHMSFFLSEFKSKAY